MPDGALLRLVQCGDAFTILLDRTELMSTRASASEEALATLTYERLIGRTAPDLLIGGYGMGYTLRAALAVLPDDAHITLAELVPEVIDWARGPMHKLTAGCLDDPRVLLVADDVAMLIESARDAYDAILLDVDNGPEGITRRVNDHLYTDDGVMAAKLALKPGGVLAVWSAWPDADFTTRLVEAGFHVTETVVMEQADGQGDKHLIWFATRPYPLKA